MAQNAFSQSDRSIFRNHILHTNPKKMLFFPKKNQKIYFFIPILKKFNFFIFSKKVQNFFFIQILKKFHFFEFSTSVELEPGNVSPLVSPLVR